ncbi:cell wall-binding repeat-containing protein, partial [Myceligenerans halotolerans]
MNTGSGPQPRHAVPPSGSRYAGTTRASRTAARAVASGVAAALAFTMTPVAGASGMAEPDCTTDPVPSDDSSLGDRDEAQSIATTITAEGEVPSEGPYGTFFYVRACVRAADGTAPAGDVRIRARSMDGSNGEVGLSGGTLNRYGVAKPGVELKIPPGPYEIYAEFVPSNDGVRNYLPSRVSLGTVDVTALPLTIRPSINTRPVDSDTEMVIAETVSLYVKVISESFGQVRDGAYRLVWDGQEISPDYEILYGEGSFTLPADLVPVGGAHLLRIEFLPDDVKYEKAVLDLTIDVVVGSFDVRGTAVSVDQQPIEESTAVARVSNNWYPKPESFHFDWYIDREHVHSSDSPEFILPEGSANKLLEVAVTASRYGYTDHTERLYVNAAEDDVKRLADLDRYKTSEWIARKTFYPEDPDTVFLASGTDFPDALSGAPVAGSLGGPVILTRKGRIGESVLRKLSQWGNAEVVILGGEGAISKAVEDEVAQVATVTRPGLRQSHDWRSVRTGRLRSL